MCQRSFGHVDHRIRFDSGSLAGSVFRIPQGDYVVGRDILAPRDFHISRAHFRVVCCNGNVGVADLGSANKTLIDGVIAEQATHLVPGMAIRIAGSTGVFTHGNNGRSS